jgi:hypothetical protein
MRKNFRVTDEAGIEVGEPLQIRPSQGVSNNNMSDSIDVSDPLNHYSMSLINDGDEWPTSAESLGKITANSTHTDAFQVVRHKTNHVCRCHTSRSQPKAFDVGSCTTWGKFSKQHIYTRWDASVGSWLPCHRNVAQWDAPPRSAFSCADERPF